MVSRIYTPLLVRLAVAAWVPVACGAATEQTTTADDPGTTSTQTTNMSSSSTTAELVTDTATSANSTAWDDDPCAACGPGTFCQWQGSDDVCFEPPFIPVACVPLPAGCDVGDLCDLPCVHSVCGSYSCFVGICDIAGAVLCTSGACDPASAEPCATEGTICKLVAPDGAAGLDSSGEFKCVPTPEQPAGVGEACSMISDGTSTWSDCAAGSECLLGATKPGGLCEQLCDAVDGPACVDPETACLMYQDDFGVCEARCDPLAGADACPSGEVCIFSDAAFACVFDASGDAGALHDPCSSINDCEPGLHCAAARQVTGCELARGDYCCTPWCDLTAPACPAGLECTPVFAMGEAPAGHEDVGECMTMP